MTSTFPGGGHGATEESPGSRDRGRHGREAPGLGLLVPGALKAHFQLRAAWLGCSVRNGVIRQERCFAATPWTPSKHSEGLRESHPVRRGRGG